MKASLTSPAYISLFHHLQKPLKSYICIYKHTHTHTQTYARPQNVYWCICLNVNMYVCMDGCINECMRTYISWYRRKDTVTHISTKLKQSETYSYTIILQKICLFKNYWDSHTVNSNTYRSIIYVGILRFEFEVFNFLFSNFSFKRLVLSYLTFVSLLPRSGGRIIQ